MKVTQISDMLNHVFGEVLGEDNLFAEDLSNVVSSGRIITGSTDVFGDNFENYAGKIIDKVGRTIFWDRVYTADDLGIWRDAFEYGSVLEKIRCDVGEYADNCEWDLTQGSDTDDDGYITGNEITYNANIANHIAELFKFYPAKVQAKYFNSKTTFKTTISITRKQLKSAFNSASELARFIGMIEQRVRTKMEISKNQLQKMVVANLIGEHIAQNKQVIDLQTLYNVEVGSTSKSLQEALNDKEMVRFIAKKMKFFREMMSEPSKLYSATGTFYNHTPVEDSRLIVLADLDASLDFNLYGETYNEEFVKLNGYKTVPFWQSSGDSLNKSLDVRSGINIKTSNGNTVTRNNILGILFDRDAAMICNEDPEVRSQYNADGNFTNFIYCNDCSYYNDFDENALIFVWGSGDIESIDPKLTKTGADEGTTIVTAASVTVPTGRSAYYKVSDDEPLNVSVDSQITVSEWSALTPGTTKISVEKDNYVNVVYILTTEASETKATVKGYGSVIVKESDIGTGA